MYNQSNKLNCIIQNIIIGGNISIQIFMGVLIGVFKIAQSIHDSFIDLYLELRVHLKDAKLLIYHKNLCNHI